MHAWGRVSDCCYNIGIGNKTKRFNKQFVRSTKVYTKSFPAHTWGRVSDCCYIGKWTSDVWCVSRVTSLWGIGLAAPSDTRAAVASHTRGHDHAGMCLASHTRGHAGMCLLATALAYHRGKSSRRKLRPTPMSYSRKPLKVGGLTTSGARAKRGVPASI